MNKKNTFIAIIVNYNSASLTKNYKNLALK